MFVSACIVAIPWLKDRCPDLQWPTNASLWETIFKPRDENCVWIQLQPLMRVGNRSGAESKLNLTHYKQHLNLLLTPRRLIVKQGICTVTAGFELVHNATWNQHWLQHPHCSKVDPQSAKLDQLASASPASARSMLRIITGSIKKLHWANVAHDKQDPKKESSLFGVIFTQFFLRMLKTAVSARILKKELLASAWRLGQLSLQRRIAGPRTTSGMSATALQIKCCKNSNPRGVGSSRVGIPYWLESCRSQSMAMDGSTYCLNLPLTSPHLQNSRQP